MPINICSILFCNALHSTFQIWKFIFIQLFSTNHKQTNDASIREYKRGKYHCTIDLLFDWFGISCLTTKFFCFCLQNRLIQTSQTGGQQYSDTFPFSIPFLNHAEWFAMSCITDGLYDGQESVCVHSILFYINCKIKSNVSQNDHSYLSQLEHT